MCGQLECRSVAADNIATDHAAEGNNNNNNNNNNSAAKILTHRPKMKGWKMASKKVT